jgi:hypothetical protein
MTKTLTHKRTQEDLLAKAVDKSTQREARKHQAGLKLAAREERNTIRRETAKFRKDFKVMFAKFRKLTKCVFDKWHHQHAIFTYKDDKWSIAFEHWHHEGIGWDGYDTNGTQWALHKWCGGWDGKPQCIVDSTQIKPGKDYSNEVIAMLRDYVD